MRSQKTRAPKPAAELFLRHPQTSLPDDTTTASSAMKPPVGTSLPPVGTPSNPDAPIQVDVERRAIQHRSHASATSSPLGYQPIRQFPFDKHHQDRSCS